MLFTETDLDIFSMFSAQLEEKNYVYRIGMFLFTIDAFGKAV